jgi:hypothetical protein
VHLPLQLDQLDKGLDSVRPGAWFLDFTTHV